MLPREEGVLDATWDAPCEAGIWLRWGDARQGGIKKCRCDAV